MKTHERTEKCRDVFALLSEYLDLELPAEACREFEAHIAGCEPCVEFAESLRKTVDLCRRYTPAEMPGPIGDAAKAQLFEAWNKARAVRGGSEST